MKKIYSTILFIFLTHLSVTAQSNLSSNQYLECLKGFQRYESINADSAMYYLRVLSADSKYYNSLQDLLHSNFSIKFLGWIEKTVSDEAVKKELAKHKAIGFLLLERMMNDSNRVLADCAKPIYYSARIQENADDVMKIAPLADTFFSILISSRDIYQNRIGRHALVIYSVLSERKELNEISDKILNTVKTQLLQNIDAEIAASALKSDFLQRRAWCRLLFGYCNSIEAKKLVKEGDSAVAFQYFKTATEYTSDLSDRETY